MQCEMLERNWKVKRGFESSERIRNTVGHEVENRKDEIKVFGSVE